MVIRYEPEPNEKLMAGEYLFALREFAIKKGINVSSLLANTNLNMQILLHPPRQIRALDVRQAGTNLVRELTDPLLSSIEFGRSMSWSSHGNLGVAIQSAETILDAAIMMEKYTPTRSEFNTLEPNIREGFVGLIVGEIPIDNNEREQDVQFFFNLATLVSIEQLLKEKLSEQSNAGSLKNHIRIHLPITEPDDFPYHYFSPSKVHFSQETLELSIPISWVSLPLKTSNLELAKAATELCERDLQAQIENDITDEILSLLSRSVQLPPLEEVAAHFCMSSSSLQRRLREKNTTYTQLKTETQRKKAKELLLTTSLPLEEIAIRLGFSDASNFSKSFKSWYGLNPGAYRDQDGTH